MLIRHARAEESRPAVPDRDRALTRDGADHFARTARGLARLLGRPAVLLTSPMLRARQTAALCSAAWDGLEPTLEPALASGNVDEILEALEAHPHDASVVMVGHEPTMSMVLTELLGGRGEAIAFGVGTAALVEINSLSTRTGRLIWFLPAAVTEALGAQ